MSSTCIQNGEVILRDRSIATWRSHPTPITYLGNWRFNDFGGERYDARRELPGWNSADLDDSTWTSATVFDPPVQFLSAQMVEPDKKVETIRPVGLQEEIE